MKTPWALPPVEEILASARVVSLPLRVRFRGVTHREVLLLDGPAGWAEFSPFLEYDDAEAAPWLRCALEAGWQGFPAPVRTSIPVNATVPAVPAGGVQGVLASFDAADTVKIKVAEHGQTLRDDVARVAEVRRLLPAAALRVDANAGWTHEQALEGLEALAGFDLQYAEQPVAGIDGLRRLRLEVQRRGLGVRIAADESVRKESDPLAVARAEAADLIIVKAQPLGGVRAALRVVADAGLPAVVSSALDSSVGIRTGVALAAALPALPYACGLGTVSLFADDVCLDRYEAHGGSLQVRDVVADPDLLCRHAASPERQHWWRERLRRCAGLLAAGQP
ncbi:MAG: o-succinylbenzoate synthase [Arthrobacter sp.]|uniref:o-succinylbenzoate synthase n=1 Tax=Arthrobacter TaxID=1663 RepID=UPI00264F5F2D|nr:o-succinylbenzoate synthase [Micrococcaceae bacterium]MDN5812356.1 o-succinylbenzoate synthase [Micrococcaceae bacterium]MDN5886243.1 o-succinylbenzoate synthase [Micrococcaceae bacterium]MDN5904041.1 o-succinylbenzoate synthase [Micrococcaceae bacterium]MDN6299974.1 o-succinylbenzoate synthase [Micrococcaceae bacterium]